MMDAHALAMLLMDQAPSALEQEWRHLSASGAALHYSFTRTAALSGRAPLNTLGYADSEHIRSAVAHACRLNSNDLRQRLSFHRPCAIVQFPVNALHAALCALAPVQTAATVPGSSSAEKPPINEHAPPLLMMTGAAQPLAESGSAGNLPGGLPVKRAYSEVQEAHVDDPPTRAHALIPGRGYHQPVGKGAREPGPEPNWLVAALPSTTAASVSSSRPPVHVGQSRPVPYQVRPEQPQPKKNDVNSQFKPPARMGVPATGPPKVPGAADFKTGTVVQHMLDNEKRAQQGLAPLPPPQARVAAGAGRGLGATGAGAGARVGSDIERAARGMDDDAVLRQHRLNKAIETFGRPTIGQLYRGDDGYEPVQPLSEHLLGVQLDLCAGIEAEAYKGDNVAFEDIGGLAKVKELLYDSVSLPLIAAHLLGAGSLLAVPKGILLFGPPGTGKTMLAKAVASKCNALCFSVSASSIGSKWQGEAEKTVKALFAVALEYQPSIVFMDEVDSLLCARTEKDDAYSGKIKTEFLIGMDGANQKSGARVLLIAATNRPDMLDEAVRRRFTKRILIPLPDNLTRRSILEGSLKKHIQAGYQVPEINGRDMDWIAERTNLFSSSDILELGRAAANISFCRYRAREKLSTTADYEKCGPADMDALTLRDFKEALKGMKPSVAAADVVRHEQFDKDFGWHGTDVGDDEFCSQTSASARVASAASDLEDADMGAGRYSGE